MRRGVKIGCGIAIVLVILLMVGSVFALQFVLSKKLKPIIDAQLPMAEEKLKVDLAVGEAGVNLFGASVNFGGIKVGNPKGFTEPTLFSLEKLVVDVSPLRFMREKKIEVTQITVKNADLTIVRNAEELINIQVLMDTINGGKKPEEEPAQKPAEKPEEKPVEEKAGPAALPPAELKLLDISSMFTYRDHAMSKEQPMELALKMAVVLKNFATFDTGVNATLAINGSMAGNSDLCKTDIKGWIAPLVDPAKPTFDIGGDIGKVDLVFVRPYMQMAGFGCDELSLKIKMVCKDGIIDGKQSVITLLMKNATLTGKMPAGVSSLPELSVPVPVEGPITAPKVNVAKAVVKAVLDNAKSNAGTMMKGAAVDALMGGGKDSKSGGSKKLPIALPF